MVVHAHPDDETIGNGATMAKYVAEGAAVTLVTCTLGEEGEVLVADLAHLAAEQTDDLGSHRLGELKAAMDILGVVDYVRLGGDGRFRDSGMAYDEKGRATARDVLRDGIFWTTDLLEAANELIPLIRDRRPQVLATYNPFGGYGHPDHIQAHRVAMYAVQLAGVLRLSSGPRSGVDGVPGALGHHEPEPGGRRHQGPARGGGHRDLQRFRPRRPLAADVRRRRRHRRGDRRDAVDHAEAGRHAGARDPDHRRTGRSSRARRCSGTASGRRRPTCSCPGCPSRVTAGPTTSSPAWTDSTQ